MSPAPDGRGPGSFESVPGMVIFLWSLLAGLAVWSQGGPMRGLMAFGGAAVLFLLLRYALSRPGHRSVPVRQDDNRDDERLDDRLDDRTVDRSRRRDRA